ncbi:hypothetical protein JKG47_18685 [Acidithiobacillus sp. MC6.1]|nr:hypothetical protein [Acidithiobacillus sp. MC6.1]
MTRIRAESLKELNGQKASDIIRQEEWDIPLPEVHRTQLKGWQQTVFWGLRAYIVVMLLVVIYAFSSGLH